MMERFGIFQSGGLLIGEEGTLCIAQKVPGSCFKDSQILSVPFFELDAKNQMESLGAGSNGWQTGHVLQPRASV